MQPKSNHTFSHHFKASGRYLPHTWVDKRIIIKDSKISGKGLFASETIRKDETLMIWGGIKIPRSSYKENKFRDCTLVPIDEETELGLPLCDKTESIDEYLNHSCDPTAWLIDEVTVVARRDIKIGDEITVDAATWDADKKFPYSDDGICYCRSLLCRKKLAFDDWKRYDLQKRYAGHFSPYIAEKIKKASARH